MLLIGLSSLYFVLNEIMHGERSEIMGGKNDLFSNPNNRIFIILFFFCLTLFCIFFYLVEHIDVFLFQSRSLGPFFFLINKLFREVKKNRKMVLRLFCSMAYQKIKEPIGATATVREYVRGCGIQLNRYPDAQPNWEMGDGIPNKFLFAPYKFSCRYFIIFIVFLSWPKLRSSIATRYRRFSWHAL